MFSFTFCSIVINTTIFSTNHVHIVSFSKNFEFIQNADFLKLTIEENEKLIDYTAAQIETKEGADSSYAFTAPGANEPTFWVDYYYGDGETTEHFVWTIGEKLSLESKGYVKINAQRCSRAVPAHDDDPDRAARSSR